MNLSRKYFAFALLLASFVCGCNRSAPVSEEFGKGSAEKDPGVPNEVLFSGHSLRTVMAGLLTVGEDGLFRVGNETEPFSGRLVDSRTGKKLQEETYWKGRLHGAQTFWNTKGGRSRQIIWRNGTRHGLSTIWYEGEMVMQSTLYSNGEKNGPSSRWYASGVKMSEKNFKKGLVDGLSTELDELGREIMQINYKNGIEESRSKWYWSDIWTIDKVVKEKGGKIFSETRYRYNTQGKKQSATTYRENIKHGLETRWFPDGNKMMESNWADNKLHGKMVSWYRDGIMRAETRWEKGKLTFKKAWKPDGAKQVVLGFKEDGSPR